MSHRFWILWFVILILTLAGCRATQADLAATTTSDRAPSAATERPEAVAFSLTTPDGDTLSLADYRGKLVLLNFWATWCPTCRAEMDSLELYYQEHQAEGLVVIGVNYKESAQAVASFIANRELSFPMLLDEDGKVAAAYGLVGLPVSYFIDCEGRVFGFWPGAVSTSLLEQKVTPFLAECAVDE